MNTFGKATLLAGASAVAMGLASTQASAFDTVDWDWYADIYEKVLIKVKIDPEFDPSGLVQVEKLQIFVGDVKANAWVEAVLHKPAAPGYDIVRLESGGSGSFEGKFSGYFSGHTQGKVLDEEIAYLTEEKKCWWGKGCKEWIEPHYVKDIDPFYGKTKGHVGGKLYGGFEWSGYQEVLVPDPFTLDQLPLVEITATAIGNAESIDSDVAVMVHEGQFVVGDGDHAYLPYWLSGKNEHTQLADALLYLALNGQLEKANISANAGSWYIQQAQADISATAVANSNSINVDAATPDDAVVIADLTQFAYADVTANAYLGLHVIDNYVDLGTLDGALTSVTATAVGNVSNITVCAVNCGDE
ncbi:MAG: hypothetical protein AAF563_13655 [Pseudomonadota bacterium]